MEWIRKRLQEFGQDIAIIENDCSYKYSEVLNNTNTWLKRLNSDNIKKNQVVALVGDFCTNMLYAILALIINQDVVVPIAKEKESELDDLLLESHTNVIYIFEKNNVRIKHFNNIESHPLLTKLYKTNDAGVMIFTSGSTGRGKCSLHKFDNLVYKSKQKVKRRALTSLVFLKIDHIGGINTIFRILFQGGTMVLINNRNIDTVCKAIEKHRVELLPTTPSFLNMMIISDVFKEYDLSSLILITYGTEPMSSSTLRAINTKLPNVKLRQSYGLTEIGIFPTKSKDNGSVWMNIGGDGIVVKNIDSILYIKSPYAMIGYLNASDPFDEDGWYNTGDEVEQDGEFYHILGRREEIINVGGEKVYPAELEGLLLKIDNVKDVVVKGKKSPIVGEIVTAQFQLFQYEDENDFKKRVIKFCKENLEDYKIPRFIAITQEGFIGVNLKKKRL